jgi:hypothetical protein
MLFTYFYTDQQFPKRRDFCDFPQSCKSALHNYQRICYNIKPNCLFLASVNTLNFYHVERLYTTSLHKVVYNLSTFSFQFRLSRVRQNLKIIIRCLKLCYLKHPTTFQFRLSRVRQNLKIIIRCLKLCYLKHPTTFQFRLSRVRQNLKIIIRCLKLCYLTHPTTIIFFSLQ